MWTLIVILHGMAPQVATPYLFPTKEACELVRLAIFVPTSRSTTIYKCQQVGTNG